MRAIYVVFVLVLAVSTVSFAAEQKNSPAIADTVRIIIVNNVDYYVVTAMHCSKSVLGARMFSEHNASCRLSDYLYPYAICNMETKFSRPELQKNGLFRVTATVRVRVDENYHPDYHPDLKK